jgi:phosphoglycerate dehydrogenase-like enzyme
MRVIIASTGFPDAGPLLRNLLPDDQVDYCAETDVAREAKKADVLIPVMAEVGADVLSGSTLKLVQQWGIGLEGVDLKAAAESGVMVCNVPADAAPGNAISTAELAIFLMMAVSRRFIDTRPSFVNGPWGGPQGQALFGRYALIVGLGKVGRYLAQRLAAFNMTVSAVKANPDANLAQTLGLEKLGGPDNLSDMLMDADYVISTVTANPTTLNLFDHDAFSRMKPGAVFVNVSRGAVMDESALLEALDSGRLSGAGLDVFNEEPTGRKHPLVGHPKVVAMPHVGGSTELADTEVARVIADNIERVRRGEAPLYQAAYGT